MTVRYCIALGCQRAATSRVSVYWRVLANTIVSRKSGTGRTTAVAPVCPGHEHRLAAGDEIAISRSPDPDAP